MKFYLYFVLTLASINTYGSSCPVPLRLIACMLLLEITAFLRETYQTLPKSSRMAGKERAPPWERLYSREANRRWSMALSSMGHSQTSAQSLQSIAGDRESGKSECRLYIVSYIDLIMQVKLKERSVLFFMNQTTNQKAAVTQLLQCRFVFTDMYSLVL